MYLLIDIHYFSKKEAMEMMGIDTSPFSQHEAIEGMRYRAGPPSGGLTHVSASHNAVIASDNHGENKFSTRKEAI